MDMFLGRRFLHFGSNIFNYARLRAALVEVISWRKTRELLSTWSVKYETGVPSSCDVLDGLIWGVELRLQGTWNVHSAPVCRNKNLKHVFI